MCFDFQSSWQNLLVTSIIGDNNKEKQADGVKRRFFVVNGKKDYYAIPYEDYDDNGGAIVFRIKNDKIKIEKKWKGRSSVQRCLYIGDHIYTIGYDGKLDSFKM